MFNSATSFASGQHYSADEFSDEPNFNAANTTRHLAEVCSLRVLLLRMFVTSVDELLTYLIVVAWLGHYTLFHFNSYQCSLVVFVVNVTWHLFFTHDAMIAAAS